MIKLCVLTLKTARGATLDTHTTALTVINSKWNEVELHSSKLCVHVSLLSCTLFARHAHKKAHNQPVLHICTQKYIKSCERQRWCGWSNAKCYNSNLICDVLIPCCCWKLIYYQSQLIRNGYFLRPLTSIKQWDHKLHLYIFLNCFHLVKCIYEEVDLTKLQLSISHVVTWLS